MSGGGKQRVVRGESSGHVRGFIGPSRSSSRSFLWPSMPETDVLGDPPYATPELPPKASKACPADPGSLSEFTPTKRGSPKVNTPSTETTRMQHAGVHRGACPLTHALSLQVLRGISPTGAAKRCLLDLLEMENRRETPATPSRGRRDVMHIAPGAPRRRLGSLEREPNAQRRTLSVHRRACPGARTPGRHRSVAVHLRLTPPAGLVGAASACRAACSAEGSSMPC